MRTFVSAGGWVSQSLGQPALRSQECGVAQYDWTAPSVPRTAEFDCADHTGAVLDILTDAQSWLPLYYMYIQTPASPGQQQHVPSLIRRSQERHISRCELVSGIARQVTIKRNIRGALS